MADSKIQWTNKTWNPIRGCSKVSAGCKHCFAERMASRFSGPGQPYEDLARDGKWTGEARFIPEMLAAPLRWRKPCRVFVNSMSDLFHESLTDDAIDAVFGAMWACLYIGRDAFDGHIFQVLTKRPARMLNYLSTDRREKWATQAIHIDEGPADPDGLYDQVRYFDGPHPRIHLGVSIENQSAADERIPLLLQCPAAVRWVSAEPLLGPIDLAYSAFNGADSFGQMPGLDWVVVGGESGPGARPMHPEWAMALRDQCKAAGKPFFFKQWGEFVSTYDRDVEDPDWRKCDEAKDSAPGQWLNIAGGQGFHGERLQWMHRVGKKRSGDILDGKRYQMFPGDKW